MSQLETTSDPRWFQALLEVFFFLVNVSIPKKDPNWAEIHHMLGFNNTMYIGLYLENMYPLEGNARAHLYVLPFLMWVNSR